MEATGKIIVILPVNSGISQRTGNPWCTQQFVLETVEQYPKKIPFEVFGEDRIRQFNLQMGETVTIHFDVDGREYNGRWYASVKCFNIVRQGQQQQAMNQQPKQNPPQQTTTTTQQVSSANRPYPQDSGADDIPF